MPVAKVKNVCLPFDGQCLPSCAKSIDECVELCMLPQGRRVAHVDLWEMNFVVNEEGREVLCQIILWRFEWHNGVRGYYVADWSLLKDCQGPEPLKGRWVGRFKGVTVSALMYRETVYLMDVEVMDRKRLPLDKRSGLK